MNLLFFCQAEAHSSRPTDLKCYWPGALEELKCDTGMNSISSTPSQDYLSSSAALMSLYMPPAASLAQTSFTTGALLCTRELMVGVFVFLPNRYSHSSLLCASFTRQIQTRMNSLVRCVRQNAFSGSR